MKLIDAKITILIGTERTLIELHDSQSATTFIEIELTAEQLSSALSRVGYTPCQISISDKMERVGKKLELKTHEFEIPELGYYRDHLDEIHNIGLKTVPEGWELDKYYGSQNSFFEKDGKKYARTNIRRYV